MGARSFCTTASVEEHVGANASSVRHVCDGKRAAALGMRFRWHRDVLLDQPRAPTYEPGRAQLIVPAERLSELPISRPFRVAPAAVARA